MGQKHNCGIRSFEEVGPATCFKPSHSCSCNHSNHYKCFKPCSCDKEHCDHSTINIVNHNHNTNHHRNNCGGLFSFNFCGHHRNNRCTCHDNF